MHHHHYVLNPILSLIFNKKIWISNRTLGRTYILFSSLRSKFPTLDWQVDNNVPPQITFNPNKIKSLKNRKHRKAFYQSFNLYKKSFKTVKKNKNPIIWNKAMLQLKAACDDIVDAVAYFAELSAKNFAALYHCSWDLAAEETRDYSSHISIKNR